MTKRTCFTLLVVCSLAACRWEASPTVGQLQVVEVPVETSPEYAAEIAEWQRNRAAGLLKEGGWLSLVGLEWLNEGVNSVGSSDSSYITLPASAPADAGMMSVRGGKVQFTSAPDANVTQDGQPVQSIEMKPDTSGEPTELRTGTVTFYVIERSGRLGVRIKDSASPARTGFAGLEYFPIDGKYRVAARFTPYDPPKMIPIVNVLGMTESMESPGQLSFEIDGQRLTLDPVLEEPGADELFVIFGDRTNGPVTYGAGRYVYTSLPAPGSNEVILDFNRSYNPPCVFTDYATCPLPPAQNKLPVEIRAGEKNYAKH